MARDMKVSHPTVHELVGCVYRHFDVNSRARLMAYFVKRRPQPPPAP